MSSMNVHDPRILRAIAHPVRSRILAELTAAGPSRAADLAADLDIPANQASFHLRQLAKYGLVEEAPEAARDKRDRVWKPVADGGLNINLHELGGNPDTRPAAELWMRTAEARAHQVVAAAFGMESEPGVVRRVADDTLRLTEQEARALGEELSALVTGWMERTRGRDPGRSTYHLMTMLQPYPETPPERAPDTESTRASS